VVAGPWGLCAGEDGALCCNTATIYICGVEVMEFVVWGWGGEGGGFVLKGGGGGGGVWGDGESGRG